MQLSVYLQVLGTFDWQRWGEVILKHYLLLLFLRWGETGSSVDSRDSGFFCWKQWRACVILSFLPEREGESAEQGSCLLQSTMNCGCWWEGDSPVSPAAWSPRVNSQWNSMEKCSDNCRQINPVQRADGFGWVSSFWSNTEGFNILCN